MRRRLPPDNLDFRDRRIVTTVLGSAVALAVCGVVWLIEWLCF